MRNFFLTTLLCFLMYHAGHAQVLNTDGSILNPNDPMANFGPGETYNENNLPKQPQSGYIGKWVRTKRMNWDTDSYKAYIYKGLLIRMKFPKNYDPNRQEKYPVIVMLHGLGESTSDYYDNENQLKHGGQIHRDAINSGKWDGFAIFPQHFGGWPASQLDKIKELVDFMVKYNDVDINRVNIHGLSMGGGGTWDFFMRYPTLFSSVIPMSGSLTQDELSNNKNVFKYTPIWIAQGGQDTNPNPNYTNYVVQQLNNTGSDLRYSLYENLGHGVWNTVYNEPDFFPFMTRANKTNPWPLFARKEFCPDDAIDVTLGVTAGFAGYQWRKDGQVIAGATTNTYRVTQVGVYDVRLKRGNEWSYWSPKPIEVKLKSPTVTPPIQIAGNGSKVIPAPSGHSVTLEMPEGYEAYVWKKVGTNDVLSTSRIFVVSQPGEYVASVTEKFGCSSNYSSPFKVVDSSGPNRPDPVIGLTAYAPSKSEVKLDWSDKPNPQNNETGFEIYRSQQTQGPYEFISLTQADIHNYLDKNLLPGIEYFYVVRPVNNTAAGDVSPQIQVKTQIDAVPPTPPINLRALRTTDNLVTLAWDAATDDVGINKYEIYRNGTKVTQTSALTTTIYNLIPKKVYNFTVKAVDLAGNISAPSAQLTVATVNSGLNYAYYEGSWSKIPDFSTLTAVKIGQIDNFNLSVRNRNDNFAFNYEGAITIPQDGVYTFYTNSNEGSILYIDNTKIVDNDGIHSSRERSGTITLTSGSHKIRVAYFEKTGGEALQVMWSGPGITKQVIPADALKDAFTMPGTPPSFPTSLSATAISYEQINLQWTDNSDDESGFQIFRTSNLAAPFYPIATVGKNVTTYSDKKLTAETTYYYKIQAIGKYGESGFSNEISSGLVFEYYEGSFKNIAALETASPVKTGASTQFSLEEKNANTNFAFIWEGKIALPAAGTYTFYTESDDGSKLWINNTQVVNNDYDQSMKERNGTYSVSQAGSYPIKVAFRQGTGGYGLKVRYSGPDIAKQIIPVSALKDLDINAKTLSLPPAPTAPTNLAVTPVSDTKISLSWKDNSNNETGFEIYRSASTDNNFLLLATLPANNSSTMSYQDADLFTNVKYYYKVTAVGAGGTSETGVVSANTKNNPPMLEDIRDVSAAIGESSEVMLFAEDVDQEILTFTVNGLPSFGTLTSYGDGTGRIVFLPTAAHIGTYNLTVKVADQHGGTATDDFVLIVGTNKVPVLAAISDLSINEGDTTTLNLKATDQNAGDELTWQATNLPSFAKLTASNRTATLKLSPGYVHAGIYNNISIKVSDGSGGTSTQKFTMEVKEVDPRERIYINVTANTNQASPWNNVKALSTTNLVNDKGTGSGVGMAFQTTWWKTHTEGAVTGNNSGVYPDNVLKEYYYFGIFGGPNAVSVKITGLKADQKYVFSFLASSKWTGSSDNGSTIFTIGSNSQTLYAQNNSKNVVSITNVSPNTSGEVLFTMTKAANTPAGYLNALVIETDVDDGNPPVAPEGLTTEFVDSHVLLSWKDTPFNEDGFEVYRSDAQGGNYNLIGMVETNVTSFTDNQVDGNTTYYYKVLSFNAHGKSVDPEVVSITTPANPPSIVPIGEMVVESNTTTTQMIQVVGAPKTGITLHASSLPAFASFQDQGDGTGILSFTPAPQHVGSYTGLEISATNTFGTTTAAFDLTVNPQKLFSVKVNFTQNTTAASPWFNTKKVPAVNDVFSNLPKENGAGTGINLKLLTAWGGTYSQGASTGNNAGIVPDAALKEYYHFGYNGAPSTVKMEISGLDPQKRYTFRFVGSSVFSGSGITDNGSTVYALDGFGSASLNVQGNTTQAAVIGNYTPNVTGKATFTLSKSAGTPIGYLNALIIDAYNNPDNAGGPLPTKVTAYGVNSSQININWLAAPDVNSYELYRSTSKTSGFSKIYTGNATAYTDNGLSTGILYYYKVKSMYADTSVESDPVPGTTILYYVYMNMNGDRAYDQASPWNNFGVLPLNGDVFGEFKNEKGNETGIAIKFEQSLTGDNDWGLTTGNNAGVYPDKVTKSFFFMENLEVANLKVLGLDQTMRYNFVFFSSINQNFSVKTDFSIGSQTVVTEAFQNTTNTETIRGVVPDENGEVRIKVTSGARWSIFNAMVIESYPSEDALNLKIKAKYQKPVSYNKTVRQASEGKMMLSDIAIYPNQFKKEIQLTMPEGYLGDAEISLADLSGKVLYTEHKNISAEANTLDLGFLNLSQGAYVLMIRINDEVKAFRVLKE